MRRRMCKNMTILPTITFDSGKGYDSTILITDIVELKKQTRDSTTLKTEWKEYVMSLSLSKINAMCNYSNKYTKEWNSSGKEPTHLGDTPFPYGEWETL